MTLVLLPEDCYDDVPCWTGTDGCNTYTVTVEWGGEDEYQLSGYAVDDMRCTPDRVHDVAAQYKQALTRTSSVAFEGDNLVLEGDHARLRYARHSPER